ncbi:MAG: GTP 3',8-cyclase MoaA, partial [Candidatus Omnitrophica bacterium]|nr:GTP 3',8-cyclase MoaA [Candidatus Omnitrophota bacterium]
MDENCLVDSFGRRISYLRISLTDRCNLRCRYCIPPGGFPLSCRGEILTYEEILFLADCFVELGIDKIRLTGGEPLVRGNLPYLVKGLSQFPELKDLSLSTNGVFLASQAEALFQAGLKRINISLDTFNPAKFKRITGLDEYEAVLAGIEKAVHVGFHPIKVNAVVMKEINDDEIEDFVRFAMSHPVEVRFIELMPTRNCLFVGNQHYVSNNWVKDQIRRRTDLIPEPHLPGDVAEIYRLPSGIGKIGFISSISHSFCSDCNRIRLRADGTLRFCLHGEGAFDLRTPLREGRPKTELIRLIREAVQSKPKGHHFTGSAEDKAVVYMCQV